jgi:hypothetical protein
MMMRQVMTGGRQAMTSMLKSEGKEEDARELRAEKEAEERAAEARERVIRRHEQVLAEEERRKLRADERAAEYNYRNALREEERAAERQRRAEELAHYEELVKKFKDVPITPEVEEMLNSKRPAQRPRSNQRNTGNNPNPDGRNRSSRRQNQPNVAGKNSQPATETTPVPKIEVTPVPS